MREPAKLLPPAAETDHRIDLTGSGSAQDSQTWLRYYASNDDCCEWHPRYPDDALPVHVDPPYRRDGELPSPSP